MHIRAHTHMCSSFQRWSDHQELRKMLLLNILPAAPSVLSLTNINAHINTHKTPAKQHTHTQVLCKHVSGGQTVQLYSSILPTPPWHMRGCFQKQDPKQRGVPLTIITSSEKTCTQMMSSLSSLCGHLKSPLLFPTWFPLAKGTGLSCFWILLCALTCVQCRL